jgi:peptidoglycan-associated lipoprotein
MHPAADPDDGVAAEQKFHLWEETTMLRRSWTVCSMTALLLGGTVSAQSPGTLLIGGFGQYTYFGDQNWENSFEFDRLGYGGRIGAFITPQLNLEADGVWASVAPAEGAPEWNYNALAARLMFSFPRGGATSFHIGAGGVLKNMRLADPPNTGTYNFGIEGGVGFNLGLYGIALRLDGLFDYFPGPSNFDVRAQAGLQFAPDLGAMFGGGDMMSSGSAWAPVYWWDDLDGPRPGTVELGGFGQWTWFDDNAGTPGSVPKDGLGFGGRLGVFLSNPRWQLEGDGYYSPHDNDVDPIPAGSATDINVHALALRLNYNFPLNLMGRQSQFIVGLGGVRTTYRYEPSGVAVNNDDYTYGYGVSGLAGLRLGVANRVALRLDGIVDYMPSYDPDADLSFTTSSRSINIHARAGLSFLIGGARPEPMCTYVGLESIPASSSNCVAPLPPPPPPAVCQYDASITATDPRCMAPMLAVVDSSAITAPIYFDFDRSTIRPDAAATLDRKIPWLQANPGMRIRIEGNADERGSDEYNLALGQRRAGAAKRYLTERGIAASRFDLVSHGEERPVCTEHNEACWQQNRRDDFFIVSIGGDGVIRVP